MTGIARETLDLWREGISPSLSLLIPTFAFPCAPADITIRIQRTGNAPLPILLQLLSRAFGIVPMPKADSDQKNYMATCLTGVCVFTIFGRLLDTRLLSTPDSSTSELLRTL